ncbi:hypothetical protein KC356_g6047 [Hortaea werneckii]|nr:hypothetical protein KC356_g6047 [Hortaea werneckii]
MEKRGREFQREDDGPLRKSHKLQAEDSNDRFTWPGQTSTVLVDVNNKELPIQISSENTRSKAESNKPRYASSRLPYVEPGTSMADGDDISMMDAPVVTGTADDQEAEASFEEMRKMVVYLQAQCPDYLPELEASEKELQGDTGPVKYTPPVVLDIIGIIVTKELCASAIQRKYLNPLCEELARSVASPSPVKEAQDEKARQDGTFANRIKVPRGKV